MNEEIRNEKLNSLLIEMVENGEHGLTVVDILVSYMNNVMIPVEQDEVIRLLKKEDS